MKKTMYLIPALALFLIISSAFITVEKASIPDAIANEYLHSMDNSELINRFETQFSDMFDNVNQIDVHQNQLGTYYYTVYGSNASGEMMVDYFKTTKQEVLSESYNYIEMNSRTWGKKKCREATVFPPPTGTFCHTTHTGYICGVIIYANVCFVY